MNVIRKDATITNTDDEFPGAFEVILSAPTLDRDGDTLLTDEWKQPLPDHITFDSDHGMSVATTVGSGTPEINDSGELVVRGTYSSLDRAQEVRTLVNEGHIRTTSVAFITTRAKSAAGKQVVTRELLNGAFVAIPSNREAVILSSKGAKTGARNNGSDAKHIQAIHDHAIALGASADGGVPDDKKSVKVKSIQGSLEAAQDRAHDALNDAYGTGAWVWLQGTLPNTLIFQISTEGSSDSQTYQQGYTDDGSAVTLTGERVTVGLTQIVKPDPDEDAEPAAGDETAAAAKTAAAVESKAAADAESDAVTDEELEAKALQIQVAQFI